MESARAGFFLDSFRDRVRSFAGSRHSRYPPFANTAKDGASLVLVVPASNQRTRGATCWFLLGSMMTEGAPSLRPSQGWVPQTYMPSIFHSHKSRSLPPTLSHKPRKDGALAFVVPAFRKFGKRRGIPCVGDAHINSWTQSVVCGEV